LTSEIIFASSGKKKQFINSKIQYTAVLAGASVLLFIQDEVERLVPLSVLKTRLAGRIVVIINEVGWFRFFGKYARGFYC